jgi:hypothetical protein
MAQHKQQQNNTRRVEQGQQVGWSVTRMYVWVSDALFSNLVVESDD